MPMDAPGLRRYMALRGRLEHRLRRNLLSFLRAEQDRIGKELIKLLNSYATEQPVQILEAARSLRTIKEDELMLLVDLVDWSAFEEGLGDILQSHTRDSLAAGGQSEASLLKGTFDLNNPEALRFIKDFAAEEVKYITGETKHSIQHLVYDAFDQGKTVGQLKYQIKKHVGLLPVHSAAVEKRRQEWLNAGMSSKVAERRAERYANKLLNWRAENIARTETIRASSQGQQELWRQMGYADEYKEWILTDDDRLCEHCADMEGQRVKVTDLFHSPTLGVSVSGSPLHPSCRCSQRLVGREETAETDPIPEPIEKPSFPGPGEFANVAEAHRYCKQKYPNIQFDFAGMDVEAVNATMEQADKLFQEYPFVAEELQYVGTYKDSSKIKMAKLSSESCKFDDEYAHATNRRIGLNPKWYGNKEKFEKQLKRDSKSGWHPKGCDTVESIFTHEFGHVVKFCLERTPKGPFEYTPPGAPRHMGDFINLYLEKHTGGKNLSRYAMKSEEEKWAEAFAAAYHGTRDVYLPIVGNMEPFLDFINKSEWGDSPILRGATLGKENYISAVDDWMDWALSAELEMGWEFIPQSFRDRLYRR